MKYLITVFIAGLTFGLGLGISGMTQPAKVIGFLDIFGNWDPSLMFVMGGALMVHFVAYRLIMKRNSPLLAPKFLAPTKRDIDVPLLVGSGIFGIGWGIGGFCPGPGLVSLASGNMDAVLFVGGMIGGMYLFELRNMLIHKKTGGINTQNGNVNPSDNNNSIARG